MITMIPGTYRNEYYGLSGDEKPVIGVPNASTFYAIDTGDIFMFDAEGGQWYQQYAQQGTQDNNGE